MSDQGNTFQSTDFDMSDFLNQLADKKQARSHQIPPSDVFAQTGQLTKASPSQTPKEDLARYNQALEYATKELEDLKKSIKSMRQQKLDVMVDLEDLKLRKSHSVEKELEKLIVESEQVEQLKLKLVDEIKLTKEERHSLVKQKVLLDTKDSVLSKERSQAESEKEKYLRYKKDILKDQQKVDHLKEKYEASIEKYNQLTEELQYKLKKLERNEHLLQDKEVEVARARQNLKSGNEKLTDQMQVIKIKHTHLDERESLIKKQELKIQKRNKEVLELETRAIEIHGFITRSIQAMDAQKQTMGKILNDFSNTEPVIEKLHSENRVRGVNKRPSLSDH